MTLSSPPLAAAAELASKAGALSRYFPQRTPQRRDHEHDSRTSTAPCGNAAVWSSRSGRGVLTAANEERVPLGPRAAWRRRDASRSITDRSAGEITLQLSAAAVYWSHSQSVVHCGNVYLTSCVEQILQMELKDLTQLFPFRRRSHMGSERAEPPPPPRHSPCHFLVAMATHLDDPRTERRRPQRKYQSVT